MPSADFSGATFEIQLMEYLPFSFRVAGTIYCKLRLILPVFPFQQVSVQT